VVSNEHVKAQFDDILDGFRRSMDQISAIKNKQAELIATGQAANKRVTVTVDAQGRIVATRFAEDIGDLDYDEISAAVTAAGQAAQDALAEKSAEILRPLREQQARLPRITDLVAGLADIDSYGQDLPAGPDLVPGTAERDGEATGPGTGVRESLW
jgi:DNA-binding protein YbaB